MKTHAVRDRFDHLSLYEHIAPALGLADIYSHNIYVYIKTGGGGIMLPYFLRFLQRRQHVTQGCHIWICVIDPQKADFLNDAPHKNSLQYFWGKWKMDDYVIPFQSLILIIPPSNNKKILVELKLTTITLNKLEHVEVLKTLTGVFSPLISCLSGLVIHVYAGASVSVICLHYCLCVSSVLQ